MNIHQAANAVMHQLELPNIENVGLCSLLSEFTDVAADAYYQMAAFTTAGGGFYYLGPVGVWTDQRLNAVILLAITTPEDFV
jgi:hypothetical protein